MSKPVRFGFAAGLILAGLSTSPASSNPFTALFSSAPEPAAEPAPAKEECSPRPGKPADGQHWVYRVDGNRKCWFLVAQETAAVKKPARRSAPKRRLDADGDNKAAPPRGKAVEGAGAELWRRALAEAPQPAPPTPGVKTVDVADAAPVPATGAAALVPPPPVLSKPDQLKPDDSNPRGSSLEPLFAATPAGSDATAVSVPVATPVAAPIVEASDERGWWTSPWLGPLLMALGALVLLLSPIWPRRRAVLFAENSWSAEGEDRPGRLRSEFDPRTPPRDRRHTQAASRPTPRRPRETIEEQRPSRSPGQRTQDVTFQEAIKALTDFDAIPIDGRSAALPPRRV